MKKSILLFIVPFLLVGCNETSNSESQEMGSSTITLTTPSEFIGTWYITSSPNGVFELNSIFEIKDDDTLEIGQRTLTLSGRYENFEGTYKYTYGTIVFIVSYDSEHNGLDWGYINNGVYKDFGFASSEPLSDTKYAYEGENFPMDLIKNYLGTTLDIPTYENEKYRLQLFTSSLYKAKSAAIEAPDTTPAKTLDYIHELMSSGYTFYTAAKGTTDSSSSSTTSIEPVDSIEEVEDHKFYIAYDSTKTYTIRIIHFADDSETDIFVYNYNEAIE